MSKQFSLQHRRHISLAHRKRGTIPPSREGCFEDLCGHVFDRLIVAVLVGRSKNRQTMWECVCQCGNKMVVRRDSLIKGTTRSCGCLHRDVVTKHGHAHKGKYSPTYLSWMSMNQRCYNRSSQAYADYGGRNVVVCESWRTSFQCFLKDNGLRPSPQHSIDRINNNGNYEPGNVRWATCKEQNRNKRGTIKIDGVPLVELAEKSGLEYETVRQRLKRGWNADLLLSPVK